MAMDPDRFQMRDLKRRISKLEDQIGYLKTDWKRTTRKVQVNEAFLREILARLAMDDGGQLE